MLCVQLFAVGAVVCAASGFTPITDPNMNGEYLTSSTPNAPGKFATDFKDYPGGVESMDIYHGPISSTYGEVFWTTLSNDLPPDVVQRFDGKAMAIVGYEIDQVRKTPEGDVSVPISMAYNHHHDTAVTGKSTMMEKVDFDRSDPRIGNTNNYVRLDHGKVWVPVDQAPTSSGLPSSAMFSDGNGGEYRKTFHAYAPPFAQIVESPARLSGSPMQIDTWNRDKMNISGGDPFVPGPYPRNSLAPVSGPDAIYSGLLECPLTTRIQKIIKGNGGFNDTYFPVVVPASTKSSACEYAVESAAECFGLASEFPGLSNTTEISTKTVSDSNTPQGCSVFANSDGSKATFVYNTQKTDYPCSASEITGTQSALIKVQVDVSSTSNVVSITMTGPSDVWFGIGFNASLMSETPYAIIVDGVTGNLSEHKMGDHAAGTELTSSIVRDSNTVTNGMRTVVMHRALVGVTKDHYTFLVDALEIDFINAIGSSATLSYHKQSGVSSLNLWPTSNTPACVCKSPAAAFGQAEGTFKYLPTGETVGFPANRCSPQPRSDLLAQKNPTCDARTYVGGLSTCHHKWTLLDADQDIPWADQPLVYYKKFRIYYQEYNASYHKQANRVDWGIGADGDHAEYDVPQCAKGTPTSECNHTITGTWQAVPPSGTKKGLVLAHFHCHAPTCLKVELWNNDTGKLLCRQYPIYGGTGVVDLKRFDEPGYIAVPPCLWGSAEHGLEAPPIMNGVTIKVVSVTNNTYGHHGEMALPEVSLVDM